MANAVARGSRRPSTRGVTQVGFMYPTEAVPGWGSGASHDTNQIAICDLDTPRGSAQRVFLLQPAHDSQGHSVVCLFTEPNTTGSPVYCVGVPGRQDEEWLSIPDLFKTFKLAERERQSIDKFAYLDPSREPISVSILKSVTDLVVWLHQRGAHVYSTTTEEGILALEVTFDSGVRLFVEVDHDGGAEAATIGDSTGIIGLDVATVGDLTPELLLDAIRSS